MCLEGKGRSGQHSQMEPTYAGLPCIYLSRNGIAQLSERLRHVPDGESSETWPKLPPHVVRQLTLKSQVNFCQQLCVYRPTVPLCTDVYSRYVPVFMHVHITDTHHTYIQPMHTPHHTHTHTHTHTTHIHTSHNTHTHTHMHTPHTHTHLTHTCTKRY